MKRRGFTSGEVLCYKFAKLPPFALKALAVYQEHPERIDSGDEEGDDESIDAAWEIVLRRMIELLKRSPKDIRYGLLRKILRERNAKML